VQKLETLQVADIERNPENPRQKFDPAAMEKLTQSIREVGVLQPLIVVPGAGRKYRLVCGERRWLAAQEAGLKEVPAIVERSLTPMQEAEIMLIENLQRANLNPIEEAMAYEKLLGVHGYKQKDLAAKLGVSQGHIANRVRLLELPGIIRENISQEIISPTHGKILAGFKHLPNHVLEAAVNSIIANETPVSGVPLEIYRAVDEYGRPLFGSLKFDPAGCRKCRNTEIGDKWNPDPPPDHRYCLNVECYEEKAAAALEASQKALNEEYSDLVAAGKRVLDLEILNHGEFERLDGYGKPEIDRADCEGCPLMAFAYSRHYSELKEVCLNPACYRKKKNELGREKNRNFRRDFSDELEQITRLSARRVESAAGFDQTGAIHIGKDFLIYIAGRVLESVRQAEGRKITPYQYLKRKFSWNLNWLRSNEDYDRAIWDDLRAALESLSERQLLEVIIEWPAMARGLGGAERWILQGNDVADQSDNQSGEVSKDSADSSNHSADSSKMIKGAENG